MVVEEVDRDSPEEEANYSDESEDEHTTTARRAQNMISSYQNESAYKIRKISSFDENEDSMGHTPSRETLSSA